MADLEQALALVQAHPERSHFVGQRHERVVAEAEAALGLTFPPTYRRFVLELGAGTVAGEEFYGVIDNDIEHSTVPDAVWLTLKHRSQSGLPQAMVLIHSSGYGDYFALDGSRVDAQGECPVVLWEEGFEVVAPDFGSFFLAGARAGFDLDEADV